MRDKNDNAVQNDCPEETVSEEQCPLSWTAALYVDALSQRDKGKQQYLGNAPNNRIEQRGCGSRVKCLHTASINNAEQNDRDDEVRYGDAENDQRALHDLTRYIRNFSVFFTELFRLIRLLAGEECNKSGVIILRARCRSGARPRCRCTSARAWRRGWCRGRRWSSSANAEPVPGIDYHLSPISALRRLSSDVG